MNAAEDDLHLREAVEPEVNPGTELARGAFINIITLVAANLRGIFTFLIARLLGRDTLGTFGIAWSTTDLLSDFGSFGMETSTIALVSVRHAVLFGLLFSVCPATFGIIAFQTLGLRLGQRPELIRNTSIMLLAVPGIA